MAMTKTKSIIVDVGTVNAASSTTRGRLDCSDAYGGILTIKITNNGVLGAQCDARVLISHDETLPAEGGAGAQWKEVWSFGGGTESGKITTCPFEFGPEVRHVEIEFGGNTTNSCTVEAIATTWVP